jgi:predicted TIM-barrel fold metal-dependent hydrolase
MKTMNNAPDIRELKLFDSCLSLGRGVLSGCPVWIATDNVLDVMDRYDIAEALVHDVHARLTYPREDGNRRLLDALKTVGGDRLHPCWALDPPKQPGRAAADAMVDEMLATGVRAARLMMKAVPPMPWLWDDLCAALEDHRVPCFLDFGEHATTSDMTTGDVDGVRAIALAHPDLPLILSGVFGGLGVHPGVVPMIKRVPNVHLDVAGILEFWREVAVDVGPERVLFSTGAPFMDPGLYVSNVQYARRLDGPAKRLICGDNLRRLLEGVR